MIRNKFIRDRLYSRRRVLSASDISLDKLYEENKDFRKLADKFIARYKKYKPGDFGYWWTIEKGNEDIEGEEYKGNINCPYNLTSLKGAPKNVSGYFSCSYSNITSLEGAPKEVGSYFDCKACDKLTSLKGAPEYVIGNFYCENCEELSEKDIMNLRDYCYIKGKIESDYGKF